MYAYVDHVHIIYTLVIYIYIYMTYTYTYTYTYIQCIVFAPERPGRPKDGVDHSKRTHFTAREHILQRENTFYSHRSGQHQDARRWCRSWCAVRADSMPTTGSSQADLDCVYVGVCMCVCVYVCIGCGQQGLDKRI